MDTAVAIALLIMQPPADAQTPAKSASRGDEFYMGIGMSLFNSYAVGNLEEFLSNQSGGSGEVGTAWYLMPLTIGFTSRRGARNKTAYEMSLTPTQSDAMQSFSSLQGYNVKLNATILSFSGALMISTDDESRGHVVGELGVDLGRMSGRISVNGETADQKGVGAGAHFALGLDRVLGTAKGKLQATTRLGYRYLVIPEMHDLDDGGSGSFYVNGSDGPTVAVDWSGLYMIAGLKLVFR